MSPWCFKPNKLVINFDKNFTTAEFNNKSLGQIYTKKLPDTNTQIELFDDYKDFFIILNKYNKFTVNIKINRILSVKNQPHFDIEVNGKSVYEKPYSSFD